MPTLAISICWKKNLPSISVQIWQFTGNDINLFLWRRRLKNYNHVIRKAEQYLMKAIFIENSRSDLEMDLAIQNVLRYA